MQLFFYKIFFILYYVFFNTYEIIIQKNLKLPHILNFFYIFPMTTKSKIQILVLKKNRTNILVEFQNFVNAKKVFNFKLTVDLTFECC